MRLPQQFIEIVLELNGLTFKNRDLVIQPLTKMMKLQLRGKINDYTPYGSLPFWVKKGRKSRGYGYSQGGCRNSMREKNSSNQDQTIKSLLGKEIIRLALPTPGKVCPESRYGLTMWKHLHR